jgi:hypothetical protein
MICHVPGDDLAEWALILIYSSGAVPEFSYWAPPNTRESSFPRKREPRKIKALDSRLRGNDGFFELFYCNPAADR